MKLVTFLTDFGLQSGYVAQMKGVLYARYPDAYCVDISHDIAVHNVKEGAFLLRSVVPHFPRGTIHVAVVDPGVGTQRRGIVVATRRHVFIGPDNGLLMPAARLFGDFAAYEITNKDLFKKPVSDTFHGRDIFAPIAAHILNGLPFEQIGPRIQDVVDISFQRPSILDNMIMGAVLYVDRFGNIVTNITSNQMQRMAHSGDELTIQMNDQRKKLPFVNAYGAVEKKGLLALIGSSGFLEISVNQGDASELLKASIDDTFQIQAVKTDSLPFE